MGNIPLRATNEYIDLYIQTINGQIQLLITKFSSLFIKLSPLHEKAIKKYIQMVTHLFVNKGTNQF